MLENVGKCWKLSTAVEKCWTMLNNVEHCWKMLENVEQCWKCRNMLKMLGMSTMLENGGNVG